MIPRQQFSNADFRKRQIDTLKVFNDNVAVVTENEEYCVHFASGSDNTSGNVRNFILTVQLGPNFPNERPKLVISPLIQHPWVNTVTGEIESAPGLLNYSPHSDLGRIVQAIIREYERFPPNIAGCASPISIPHQLPATNPMTSSASQLTTAKSLDSGSKDQKLHEKTSINKVNENSLPNLSTLSLDELKQLDTDPQFFDDFIEEMSVVQQLNEELDSMINQVEIISRENESKETHLVELKRKLSDDVTALKNLGEKCDQLNKKYLKKSEEFAPQHIRVLRYILIYYL